MKLVRYIMLFSILVLPVVCMEMISVLHTGSVIILSVAIFAIFIIIEINRRKKIERNLRNYIELVDYSQVVIRNMRDEITAWNKGMENLYGWKKEEVTGRSTHQLFATVFPQPLEKINELLLKNNEWQGELKHVCKNGSVIEVSSHWSLIRNKKGEPKAIVETNIDVTVLKKAEERIASLSLQINQSKDAIYTLDTSHKIQSWNRGAENLYEFSSKEATGQISNKLLQTCFSAEELNITLKQLREHDYWSGELKRKTKTGKTIFVFVSMSTIRDHAGIITGYVSVSHNITSEVKLRDQVAHLANLVEQSHDAIISVTLDGKLLSWNNSASRLYGYPAEEVLGKNVSILVPPHLVNDERVIINEIVKGNPVQQYETERVKKDGSQVFISITLSPVKNSDGLITGVSGIARNISERREAEKKIIQSEENLKAIFENGSESFILLDTKGIVKAINQRARNTILISTKKAIKPGKSIFDYTSKEKNVFSEQAFASAMKGNTSQYDHAYINTKGSIIWLNFTYNAVREDDIIKGVCLTMRDVTEKKLAEQQKEFDRNNLNALINTTGDLMWSVSRDFTLITSNHAFNEMTKRMAGKRIEKGADVFGSQFNETQQQRYRQYYERAFAGEVFTELEYTFSGFEYWAENSFYPIYEGDMVIGTACFSRNVSEQKKAAELLQLSFNEKEALAERMSTTLNTLPANIALLNDKGIIIDVNNAWRNFGFDHQFQGKHCGIGQNYLSIAETATGNDETDGKKVAAGIRSIINNKEGEFIYEYACHSLKEKRWFRMVATPLKDKEYAGAVVMHVDISEVRQLEQERMQNKVIEQRKITRVMLQAQEKERNELGRELHDNICQILAAVKMKLSFCVTNPNISLPIIKEAIHYMEEAVTETRNLSHRMLMPRFAESSLADALQNLTAAYNHNTRKVALRTETEEEKHIPAAIKETLYRIAQEQLHNIEKYAQASNVIVHLNSLPDVITMFIEDNGIGFDPKKKRAGVGLTNIKNRTESFNGSVKIISAKGEGCVLMVEIPLQEKAVLQ